MRRADRLFEIIQLMRRQRLVRASDLAARLEVSERTIYRDIRDLIATGVPIEGEAGVGYTLRQGFDLPPLMFDQNEIEALVLGARIVESWTDVELADAAANVIAKVEAVIPDRLRQHMADIALLAPAGHFAEPIAVDPSELREALRQRRKVHFQYRDGEDRATARTSARSGSIALRSSTCSTSGSAPSAARRSTIFSSAATTEVRLEGATASRCALRKFHWRSPGRCRAWADRDRERRPAVAQIEPVQLAAR
jgi:biotin operon repressor